MRKDTEWWLRLPRGVLLLAPLLIICLLCGCGQANIPPVTMQIEGYGGVELLRAKWSQPFDASKLQNCMKAVNDCHQRNSFVPFLVEVFAGHAIVKSIKDGSAVVVHPERHPELSFWLPLKEGGRKVLLENKASGSMKLLAPPPEITFDLSFASESK
jgi:hypothetical protein